MGFAKHYQIKTRNVTQGGHSIASEPVQQCNPWLGELLAASPAPLRTRPHPPPSPPLTSSKSKTILISKAVKVIDFTLFFLQRQRSYKIPLEICWEIICSNFSPYGLSLLILMQSSAWREKHWFISPLILTLHNFRDSCNKAIFLCCLLSVIRMLTPLFIHS